MVYKVKLLKGSYSLHGVGNFEVDQEKIVSEDVYKYLSGVTFYYEDKQFPYFATWVEEDETKEVGSDIKEPIDHETMPQEFTPADVTSPKATHNKKSPTPKASEKQNPSKSNKQNKK